MARFRWRPLHTCKEAATTTTMMTKPAKATVTATVVVAPPAELAWLRDCPADPAAPPHAVGVVTTAGVVCANTRAAAVAPEAFAAVLVEAAAAVGVVACIV